MSKKILLVGESWMSYTTHVKGFDSFCTSSYETGEKWLVQALESAGHTVDYMPNHIAMDSFPYTIEELSLYDCLILSDIGANTLLLPTATFCSSNIKPNRCNLIREFVLEGGSLLMIGGYMTFSGVDGKGKWQDTAVQDVLPVNIFSTDDRMEHSEGVHPKKYTEHEILNGLPSEWPPLLGYNKTELKNDAQLLVTVGNDPLIAIAEYGKGRSAVFTSDCAPHWAPPMFINWECYNTIWINLVKWMTG